MTSRTWHLFACFPLLIWENAPKKLKNLNSCGKILCTGRSNNPHFGFPATFHDSWGPDRAGFWNFYFSGIFRDLMSRIFRKIPEKWPNLSGKWSKFSGKVEISKSGSIRPSGIIRSCYKTKIGVMGPTSAENFSAPVKIFSIFWAFSPIIWENFAKRCRVRDIGIWPPFNFFEFRKKFLDPHILNFYMC